MSLESDFSISPVRRPLPQDNPERAHVLYCLGSGVRLEMSESVLSSMRRQCSQNSLEETGGVLLGRHLETEHGYVVIVDDHLPVPSGDRSAIHFTFDEQSIQAIFARVSTSIDYVVGWYHSHVSGAPFMSKLDCRLHQEHFPMPWHVSCVVGAGEWGMPVDFWRLSDGELIGLEEYAVVVKPGAAPIVAHQRYLRACLADETHEPVSADFAAPLLADLGVDLEGPLGQAIQRAQLSTGTSATRLDELRLVIDLAVALAASPAAAHDLSGLNDKLARTRALEDMVSVVALSGEFRGDMSFCGTKGIFLTPGSPSISWFDAALNMIWPVNLPLPVFAACFSADGTAWLATDGALIRLDPASGTSLIDGPQFEPRVLSVTGLAGEPRQVAVHGNDLWMATSERWCQIPVGSNEERIRLGAAWDLPAEDACVLVSGLGQGRGHDGYVITQTGDLLRRWHPDGTGIRQAAEQSLPSPWCDWRIDQACLGSNGVCLLFDNGRPSQIGMFDPESLELKRHYVRNGERGASQLSLGICADPLGRLYLLEASTLYRFRP